MANYCDNWITIASDGEGMRAILREIIANLKDSGWVDSKEDIDSASLDALAKRIFTVVNFHPAYIDALSKDANARCYGESAFFSVDPFTDNIWLMNLSFKTKWGPITDEDVDCFNNCKSHSYLFAHAWREEAELRKTSLIYLFDGDAWGVPYKASKADREYGKKWLAASYRRAIMHVVEPGRVVVPDNQQDFNKLLKSNDAKVISRVFMGRDFTRFIDGNSVGLCLRNGCYESCRLLLGKLSGPISMGSISNYLASCCEAGQKDLALLLVEANDWNALAVTKTAKSMRSHGWEDVAAYIEEIFSEREEAKHEAEADLNTGIIKALNNSDLIDENGALTLEPQSDGGLSKGIVVPAGCFEDRTDITSVIFNGRAEICEGAFSGCENLKSATFEGSATVGNRSFSGCTSLQSVVVNGAEFGSECFSGCISLSEFKILPKTAIYKFGKKVFDGCISLVSLRLEMRYAKLAANAFGSVPNLTEVSIVGYGTSIAKNAFKGCPELKKVKIGKKNELGKGALSELGSNVTIM